MTHFIRIRHCLVGIITAALLCAFHKTGNPKKPGFTFPYEQAGLTKREAAAHLLSRFSYGATTGQVDQVVQMGLENWFTSQLAANQADDSVQQLLSNYDALKMNTAEIVHTFPDAPRILKMAIDDGIITKEEAGKLKTGDRQQYRARLAAYMKQKDIRPRAELLRQLINQKILRAAYSNNQLQEVLTAFWFNHFNVSVTKNETAHFILSYERDVIRPHVLGKFEDLLLATAKSPAMLTYLDNAKSMVDKSRASSRQLQQQERMTKALANMEGSDTSRERTELVEKIKNVRKQQGLNENYAREIMELHTMGVDGGYTQADVTEAARILTGWTVYPMEGYGRLFVQKLEDRMGTIKLERAGFVHEGSFLFAANRHDFGEKKFLETPYPPGEGYDEGLRLIHTLAYHPSTAKFICTKLAARFVSDTPATSLVNKMMQTFTRTNGDIKAVLITMTTASEFWSETALREKIKSPFELMISTVRATGASIRAPLQLYRWCTKMGEDIYHYQAPTGFPDRGRYWINTGSLLYRMNFGLAFANGQIPGVSFNIYALNNKHEPESAEAALKTFGSILMPERDLTSSINRLLPLVNDPAINKKITGAIGKDSSVVSDENEPADDIQDVNNNSLHKSNTDMQSGLSHPGLAQVVGILLGSPEFQRR